MPKSKGSSGGRTTRIPDKNLYNTIIDLILGRTTPSNAYPGASIGIIDLIF